MFLFEFINDIMCSHIDKDLLTVLVLRLYYEASHWLYNSSAFWVNYRLPIFIGVLLLIWRAL